MTDRQATALQLGLLILLTVLVWGQTIGFGFVWDDKYFVVDNPAVRHVSYLPHYFTDMETSAGIGAQDFFPLFRPLRNVSYLVDYLVAGLNPAWWHTHNVALHVLNSFLVLLIARKLLASRIAPLFAAAIYLIHPVQTEVVAWVKCRDDLLAVFFVLLCFNLWLRWKEDGISPARIAALSGLYLAACLSKVQAIVLPLIFLLYVWWIPTEGTKKASPGSVWKLVACLAPVGLIFLLWRHMFIGRTSQAGYVAGSFLPTMLTMSRVGLGYLRLLVFPRTLVADYSGIEASTSYADLRVLGSVLLLTAMIVAVIALRRKQPVATFGLVWCAVFLLPVLNFIPMMQFMAERFLHLSMPGFALALAALLGLVEQRSRSVASGLAVILVLGAGARTIARIPVWDNSLALYEATVRDTPPGTIRPRRFLCHEYILREDFEKAAPLALELRRIHMEDANASTERKAEYTRLLGYVYVHTGKAEEGIALLHEAIEIEPAYAQPYMDLGHVEGQAGGHELALEWFDKAVAAGTDDASAHHGRGIALREIGRIEEAEAAFREALRHVNLSPSAYKALAALLWSQGRIEEALPVYREAAELWPEDEEIAHWLERAEEITAGQGST